MLEYNTPELAGMLARGACSAEELMRESLARIAEINPRHNALVSLRDPDEMLAEARGSDARRRSGRVRGPFEGLPTAIKDTNATAGIRTTQGSLLLKDNIPAEDTPAVGRIRAAGALVLGKSNVPEYGLGSHTYNSVFGITRNAWNPALSAGGSSGGAAVALAQRMVALADGSDMGGSLRNPAAWNNLFGFRPSFGRVPKLNPDSFMTQLGTEGPMGRTVEELLFVLAVQAGRDPRAPHSLDGDGGLSLGALPAPVAGRRILWLGDLGGHLATEPGVLALCEQGLRVFEGLGCGIETERPAHDWEAVWQSFVVQRYYEGGSTHLANYQDPAKRALMKPELHYEVEGLLRTSAADLAAAAGARSRFYQAMLAAFERVDVLALPTAQCFAFPAEWHWPKEVGGRAMDSYHRWMEVTIYATLMGCSCATVPCGFDPEGRAMGMQLIGRPRADMATLQLAHAYQLATPFAAMRPGA